MLSDPVVPVLLEGMVLLGLNAPYGAPCFLTCRVIVRGVTYRVVS